MECNIQMLKSTSKIAAHQRKWYGKWHTWAGIFAGSILLIVTLTGALLVYERELDEWFYQDTFTFDDTGGKRLTFQEVHDKVMEQRPDWEIGGVFEYNDSQKAYSMFLFHQNLQVIVDPYTGLITSERVYAKTVMGFIRKLHRTLLIPTWGKYIVGIASLLMVSLMVTGLRLWIPRKWKYVKKRLTIKRGVGFKRQNYDFHNILGFYFSPVIALLALTGVAITFAQ